MKSIKEAAEEHSPYTREDSWNRVLKCIIAQTSFEAGANYVLEQIESLTKYNRWSAQDLYNLIEKLKKPINSRV
jgi:hypothetical protein